MYFISTVMRKRFNYLDFTPFSWSIKDSRGERDGRTQHRNNVREEYTPTPSPSRSLP